MCLTECRVREQTKPTNEPETPLFEMVPHWPGIRQSKETGKYYLSSDLHTKESLLNHKGILRLAFELPPIMLPRRVTP